MITRTICIMTLALSAAVVHAPATRATDLPGKVTAVRSSMAASQLHPVPAAPLPEIVVSGLGKGGRPIPIGKWQATRVSAQGIVAAPSWNPVGIKRLARVGIEATTVTRTGGLSPACDSPAPSSQGPATTDEEGDAYDPLGPPRIGRDAWIADGNGDSGSIGEKLYQNALKYQQGRGVAKDLTRALQLFVEAASLGHAEAAESAGTAYELGLGTAPDDGKAVAYYRQAAIAGRPMAQNNYGAFFATGRGGLPADDVQSLIWYRKAAAQGNGWSQANLCVRYEGSNSPDRNLPEALRLCRLAVAQNNPVGLNQLGWMYQRGSGVEQDLNQAFQLYKRSAELGFANGQNNLGYVYEQGWGVNRDLQKALYWYRKAAAQGFAHAQWNLGRMHDEGIGIPRNETAAIEYYRQAARAGHQEARKALEKKGLRWD